MEAKLNQFVRTKGYENSETMTEIRRRITEEVELILGVETKHLQEENKQLRDEELAFRENAKPIIKHAYETKALVGVKTQVGPKGSIIHEYVGHVEKLYSSDCFNFVDPNEFDGKPFTIGLSCLLSIKILYGAKAEEETNRGKCLNLKIVEVLPYE
jgi:hypothetical protein